MTDPSPEQRKTPHQTLHHITLNTGHAVVQRRDEIPDSIVRSLSAMLGELLAGRTARLPGLPDFCLEAVECGHSNVMHATLRELRTPARAAVLHVVCAAIPHRASWIAVHTMHNHLNLVTDGTPEPEAPWLADIVAPGIILAPDVAAWSGDFSRCLGFAWLHHVQRRTSH